MPIMIMLTINSISTIPFFMFMVYSIFYRQRKNFVNPVSAVV